MKTLPIWAKVLICIIFAFGLVWITTPPTHAASVSVDDPACGEFSAVKSGGSISITCSAQPPITPPAPQPATPVCTLTANPVSITAGGSSLLSASCSGATSVKWSSDIFGKYSSGGSVSPTTTTTYSIAGTNFAGTGNAAQVTVYVTPSGPARIPDTCANNGRPLQVVFRDLDWNIGSGIATHSGDMGYGQAYIYRLVTGVSSALAQLEVSEYIGTIPYRTVVISETPCDFDALKPGNAYGFGLQASASFSVGQTNVFNYRVLKPNTTYFINIKNATFDRPDVDTCLGDCQFIMFLRH